MTGTLVGPAAYPSADRFDESAVELEAYDLLSRYEDAAALLEDASLSAERVEPSPSRSDEPPRVTARRWLSALVDHCERRYGGLVARERDDRLE